MLRKMVFLGATATAAAMAYADTGVTPATIKIGVFGELTGPAAVFGYANSGAIMIYRDVNDKGGIHGRKIEVVHEDGACNPAKTLAAVKKLIHQDQVFMLHGGVCSNAVLAAKEEIVSNKVPYMVMAAAVPAITEPVTKYMFTTTQTTTGQAQTVARFVASMPDPKRVALIYHPDDWGNAMIKPLVSVFESVGVKPVATEVMERGATDSTAQVLKLRSAKADVIVVFMYPAESAIFIKDAKKYGLNARFLGNGTTDFQDMAKRAGGYDVIKDLYAPAFLAGPVGSTKMKPFEEMLRKHFPSDRVQALSFFGTAGAVAVVEALRRAGPDLTRDKLVAELEKLQNTDTGSHFCKISFSASDHQGCKEGTMWGLKGQTIVDVGPTWPKQ
jgi:branched-chain amino acid transport system substrate-binding protein